MRCVPCGGHWVWYENGAMRWVAAIRWVPMSTMRLGHRGV